MTAKLKVGLIGCGGIGRPHVRALARLHDVEIAAVCDVVPENAHSFAARFGGEPYTDYRRLVERKDIDCVVVTTPPSTHAQPTIAALESGKHVMVQKPMALTLAEADAMIAAAERSGKQMMVSFFEMYHPAFRKAKELVDQGTIGKVFFMKAIMAWWSDTNNWRLSDPKVGGGGILMDGHIHHVALFEWFSGSAVETVLSAAGTLNSDAPVEDTGVTILQSKSALAEISGSNRIMNPIAQNGRHFKEHYELFGSNGTILIYPLQRPSLLVYTESEQRVAADLNGWVSPRLPLVEPDDRIGFDQFNGDEDPWVGLHRDFIDCIKEGRPVPTPGAFGRKALEIVLAAYHSVKTGQRVRLPFGG